jgi:hypothetical protein
MVCVVNRKYEFDAQELFHKKMKGVKAAATGDSTDSPGAPFIDLVFADAYSSSGGGETGLEGGEASWTEVDASASLVREAFLGGDPAVERRVCERLLPPAVREYIRKHDLLPPRPKCVIN